MTAEHNCFFSTPCVLTPRACQVLEGSEGWREIPWAERERKCEGHTNLNNAFLSVVWSVASCWQECLFTASLPLPHRLLLPHQRAASCQISGRLIGCSSTDMNDSWACDLRARLLHVQYVCLYGSKTACMPSSGSPLLPPSGHCQMAVGPQREEK